MGGPWKGPWRAVGSTPPLTPASSHVLSLQPRGLWAVAPCPRAQDEPFALRWQSRPSARRDSAAPDLAGAGLDSQGPSFPECLSSRSWPTVSARHHRRELPEQEAGGAHTGDFQSVTWGRRGSGWWSSEHRPGQNTLAPLPRAAASPRRCHSMSGRRQAADRPEVSPQGRRLWPE